MTASSLATRPSSKSAIGSFSGPDGRAPRGAAGRWLALAGLLWLATPPAPATGADPVSLHLVSHEGFLSGTPVLVRVELRDELGRARRDIWDARVSLATSTEGAGIAADPIPLRNGLGTRLAVITSEAAEVEIVATVADSSDARAVGLQARRLLRNLSGEPRVRVSGDLPAGLTEWSGIVEVADAATGAPADVRVPAGSTLRILPGTLVLLAGVPSGSGGSDLRVQGAIESLGTEARPVALTAREPERPWGEIHHDGADPSLYRYTHIHRAGRSRPGGHTNTGPAFRLEGGSRVVLESCSVSDNAGKVMQANNADLELRDTILARSVMGPEISGTALHLETSWLVEMTGEVQNAGNDGDAIYIHNQHAGQEVLLRGAVIASVTDDGIDTLGARVTVEDSIVRDVTCDKGMSVFGGAATVRRSIFADNDKGLSAKSTGGSEVRLDHVTFVGNRWCIESRRKTNASSPENRFTIENSILWHNGAPDGAEGCESNEPVGGRSIRTDFASSWFTIRYSILRPGYQVQGTFHEEWPDAGAGNSSADPRFRQAALHDFRLDAGSPGIDAGDPAGASDPDGTPPDIGAIPFSGASAGESRFRRADANRDGALDISDPVYVLLHLFAGGPLGCEDAADTNDDGGMDISDPIWILAHLFQGGPPPPPPSTCGVDPTSDDLGCLESGC